MVKNRSVDRMYKRGFMFIELSAVAIILAIIKIPKSLVS